MASHMDEYFEAAKKRGYYAREYGASPAAHPAYYHRPTPVELKLAGPKRKQHFAHHSSDSTWRDAQGKLWQIWEMTDGHLCNTIRMLGRRFAQVQQSHDFIGYDPGFAARGPKALFPVYEALFNEAVRRGLTP